MTTKCITTAYHITAAAPPPPPPLLPLPTFWLTDQLHELLQLSLWPQKVNFCKTNEAIDQAGHPSCHQQQQLSALKADVKAHK